jgi:Tfp pilus assembly pilus retraction ATPase PilT
MGVAKSHKPKKDGVHQVLTLISLLMDTEGLCTNWQLTDTRACFANSRCGEVRNMLDNWLTMKQQLAEFETQGEHDLSVGANHAKLIRGNSAHREKVQRLTLSELRLSRSKPPGFHGTQVLLLVNIVS